MPHPHPHSRSQEPISLRYTSTSPTPPNAKYELYDSGNLGPSPSKNPSLANNNNPSKQEQEQHEVAQVDGKAEETILGIARLVPIRHVAVRVVIPRIQHTRGAREEPSRILAEIPVRNSKQKGEGEERGTTTTTTDLQLFPAPTYPRQAQEEAHNPPPLPKPLRRAPDHPSKRLGIVFPSLPSPSIPSPPSPSPSTSGWNPLLMRRMYSEFLARRGIFSVSQLQIERDEIEREERDEEMEVDEVEEKEVYEKQKRFFRVKGDGEFWDPFGEVEGSLERALRDESLHGLMVSPRIVGAEYAMSGKDGDMFNGWSSVSLEDGNVGDDGRVEKNEIVNPVAGQFEGPGNEWTALAQRGESMSSDYAAPSRLPPPVLHMRKGENLLYSPIQNSWTSVIGSANESRRFIEAAVDFFSGFDVEALVASTQEPGYEFLDTDSGKGSPERFRLKPHRPKSYCGCEFCYRHHHPTLEILKLHDPNEWCHCSACMDFRDNRNMERNRAEQNAAWKARLDALAKEVDDARAEEESRLLDLPNFMEEDNQEDFKPKKSHRLGEWVRSHLRNPSPRE